MNDVEPERHFTISPTERYEMDVDKAYLYVTDTFGPQHAGEWLNDLDRVLTELPNFPGPRANAIDQEATEIFGCEVRRILYYGPAKKRPARVPYRIFYTIIEPPDSTDGFLRILRLVHGSRPLIMPEE